MFSRWHVARKYSINITEKIAKEIRKVKMIEKDIKEVIVDKVFAV